MDILERMDEKFKKLSKGQKLIASYIKLNFDKAPFMTAAVLGEEVGISESTVVRFAVEMGFEGYPEFQKSLQGILKNKLTSNQRLEVSASKIADGNVAKIILKSDVQNIKRTLEGLQEEDFLKVVENILTAKRIYIIAVRSSAPLASFMGHYFNLMFESVKVVHTTDEGEMFEQVIRAKEGDVVIGISFPRYSNRTIKALEVTRRQGATAIAITDSEESPLAQVADLVLKAHSDMAAFADSLVAPLSLINALIVALGMRRKDTLYGTFNSLEKLWDEYGVYQGK